MSALDADYSSVVNASGGKPVYGSETGWPSSGNTVGLAVPNAKNAAYYYLAFNSWVRAKDVKTFYFEGFDEPWKTAEGPQGAHWGVHTTSGALKPGMSLVYSGTFLPQELVLRTSPVDSSGPAVIAFTSIPAYGNATAQLQGAVFGLDPTLYRIATYINVSGGWWTKPTFASPTVSIAADGSFNVSIVTGGNDQYATEIATYAVPAHYSPPQAGGAATIPEGVVANAATSFTFERPVDYAGGSAGLHFMNVSTFSLARSFMKAPPGFDTVALSGILSLPDGFALLNKTLQIDVAGLGWTFGAFSKTGLAKASDTSGSKATGVFSMTYIARKRSWLFTASLRRSAGDPAWNDIGLLNTTIYSPGVPVFIPVSIFIDGEPYRINVARYYTASSGKSGIAK